MMSVRMARLNLIVWIGLTICNILSIVVGGKDGYLLWVTVAASVITIVGVFVAIQGLRYAKSRANIHKELRRARDMSMKGR